MANTTKRDRREYHRQYRLKKKQGQTKNGDILSVCKDIDEKSAMLPGEVGATLRGIIAEEIDRAFTPVFELLKERLASGPIIQSPAFTPPPFPVEPTIDA